MRVLRTSGESGVDLEKIQRQNPAPEERESGVGLAPKRLSRCRYLYGDYHNHLYNIEPL
jgi:hypothetical protein